MIQEMQLPDMNLSDAQMHDEAMRFTDFSCFSLNAKLYSTAFQFVQNTCIPAGIPLKFKFNVWFFGFEQALPNSGFA
jgi:hypothetical protein